MRWRRFRRTGDEVGAVRPAAPTWGIGLGPRRTVARHTIGSGPDRTVVTPTCFPWQDPITIKLEARTTAPRIAAATDAPVPEEGLG